jgi:hypothetical protein
VIRLQAADGDDGIRVSREGLGDREFELPNIVTAEPEWDRVVSLREQPRPAAEERAEARHLLHGCGTGQQRKSRGRRGHRILFNERSQPILATASIGGNAVGHKAAGQVGRSFTGKGRRPSDNGIERID